MELLRRAMTANELLQWVSWAIYLVIFGMVAFRAVRRPTRAHLDILAFFADTTAIIIVSTVGPALRVVPPIWLSDVAGVLLLALPYLLLRLVADFSQVPTVVLRATEVGLALSALTVVILPTPMPTAPALVLVAYFLVVIGYVAWGFIRHASRSSGVTRRRMQSIAVGTVCLGLVLLIAGLMAAVPANADLWMALSQCAGIASGIAYFVGFVPPTTLRRAWQEPEVRASLSRSATLPHLPDIRSIVTALEEGAAESLGAPAATLGLWDATTGKLRFYYKPLPTTAGTPETLREFGLRGDMWELEPRREAIFGRAFNEQRAVYVADVQEADPLNADLSRAYGARCALAAPINAGKRRLGVLVVYAPREPIFADSDMELLRLLCDQAAVVLESRALVDEAARMHAREEALRLKEDFISSAAHEVKTPLTGVLMQSQLLLRRADQEPIPAVQKAGLERIVRETRRLARVLTELLNTAQLENADVPLRREPVDLVALANELTAAHPRCRVEAAAAVIAEVDRIQVGQLLEHVLANALMYDTSGSEILIRVWRDAHTAQISIRDDGIGIPPEDLAHVFERFHRGHNIDDRRYAGLGLGLYASRRIVERHGGAIRARSISGAGTTIEIELPLTAPESGPVERLGAPAPAL